MKARELHSRLKAAAAAFKAAGGRNPRIVVDAQGVVTIDEAVNSTNLEEAAKTQALIDQGLGGSRSQT